MFDVVGPGGRWYGNLPALIHVLCNPIGRAPATAQRGDVQVTYANAFCTAHPSIVRYTS